ncbi:MAG: DinB family protein [Bacteroidota bacterium]
MTRLELFRKELAREAIATRKMLAAVPNNKFDWKPHPKSMSIRQLANHIADLPAWPTFTLNSKGLDFAKMEYTPKETNDTAALTAAFESNLKEGLNALDIGKEETLDELWTLRNGEQVYSVEPKAEVIRMSISQIIHHRAQLGVFLRLLDVAIPGSYGPSADESF